MALAVASRSLEESAAAKVCPSQAQGVCSQAGGPVAVCPASTEESVRAHPDVRNHLEAFWMSERLLQYKVS